MIHQLSTRMREVLTRFRRHEGATAAVEFALIMPFLITLYFGSMEGSALFTADRRVNTISATVGDLVSQWDPDEGAMSVSTTLNDYFAAAQALMFPMSTTGLKQVVTYVQVKSDGTTVIIWSKAYNGGTARTVGNSYPLPASKMMNTVARGGYIIAAETYYSYKPLLGVVFPTAISLYHENIYLPRFGNTSQITLST
jgi:Flp pilus assembly protein TadG